MIHTKIVATVGPASRSMQMLERFVAEGVDVVRFNLSHADHDVDTETLATLRSISEGQGRYIAALADLGGPKVRLAEIDPDHADLAVGDTCLIVREPIAGNATRLGTTYPRLIDDVEIGDRVLIDDGVVRLLVVDKSPDTLICTCTTGGRIASRKGVNLPDSNLSIESLTPKDLGDLDWIVAHGLDYVALSFVRTAADIVALRKEIQQRGGDLPIIAKIETPEAVQNLDPIIAESDAILVARGDLGVEMDVALVPMLQKDMVRRCRSAGKPVIIATQMLHSMVDHIIPTRAEASDVANAILDGTDAVMLSAESAVGRYPVEAVSMLNRISQGTHAYRTRLRPSQRDAWHQELLVGRDVDPTTAAVARSVAVVASDLGARLVAVWCRTGRTARWISKYRMAAPIAALCRTPEACRQMALCYGADPILVDTTIGPEKEDHWSAVEPDLIRRFELASGDTVVVVGDPRTQKREPSLAVHVVGEPPA